MNTIEKEIERLKSKPKDFTYDELKRVLNYFGFYENNKGKTSGSRVVFRNKENEKKMEIHKPYPSNMIKTYCIKNILNLLEEWRIL